MKLLITSAVSGEGKSTVTLELAKLLAGSGRKVTVIDADLHRPVIGRRCGLKPEKGLVSYLKGRSKIKDVLYKTDAAGLSVVPAVEVPGFGASGDTSERTADPFTLLRSERFSELLGYLLEKGEDVLIDTPGIGMLPDASVLLPLCDGCVIVRSARDEGRHVRRMHAALAGTNVIAEIRNDGAPADLSRLLSHII